MAVYDTLDPYIAFGEEWGTPPRMAVRSREGGQQVDRGWDEHSRGQQLDQDDAVSAAEDGGEIKGEAGSEIGTMWCSPMRKAV